MKNKSSIFLSLTTIATSAIVILNSSTIEAKINQNISNNNLVENRNNLIAQSRTTYRCKFLGINGGARLEPNVSGGSVDGWDCFIPVERGKCVAIKEHGNPFAYPEKKGPGGFWECNPNNYIETDPATGKKYYKFSAVSGDVEVILEK